MFDTKVEIDRHVKNCLDRVNSDVERNSRGLPFAKLYFKIGAYEQALQYLSSYLTVQPKSAEAWKLQGNIFEKQEQYNSALVAYRKSLDRDPKQNSLIIKVCELLSKDKVDIDVSNARNYYELAQSFDPHNPAVFDLKERLLSIESSNPDDVAKLLINELESRPADVQLRVRLMRHLLQNNQIKEAYKHLSDIEDKNLNIFLNNLSWYEIIADVLVRYLRDNTDLNWNFWILIISVMDKLTSLTLDDNINSCTANFEPTTVVFNLDQTLAVAASNLGSCKERVLVQEFLNHYQAQLCFHYATVLFKQAKRDLIKYKDAMNMALPLLFVAYHTQPADLHSMWLDHSTEVRRQQVQRWHRDAAFRCSQAGHIILAAAKDQKKLIIEKAVQNSSGLWREKLFKKVFVTREQQSKLNSSYFVTCSTLTEIVVRLPDLNDLVKYDEVAQVVYPGSLHHLVWICLNSNLSSFRSTFVDGLKYSVKHLNNCAAESLSILDIDAFLYCTTLTAQAQLEELKHQILYNNEKPSVLPASITDRFGTSNQTKWLMAAYKVYRNEFGSDTSELRLNLIRGIEVVRCVGNHGLDVKLLIILANAFAKRANKLEKQSEIEFNEARAELYWKAALPLLEKMQKNQAVTYSSNRLFEYKSKEMNPSEISSYISDGKLFIASQLMKKKEHEKALKMFEALKSPYASFYQAQIYKGMAEEQVNQNKENVTSEMRSQHIILLSRARDYFYLTLDRLRDPSVDRKHPLNNQLGTEIEKIERMLSRIDPDVYNHRNECDGMSDENTSSAGSMGDNVNLYSSTFYPGESMTPQFDRTIQSNRFRLERREARPSPERLDAQLRQLQASRDATITQIMEQNRIVVETQRTIVDELKSFREAVSNLSSNVEELKHVKRAENDELQSIKDSINGLKTSVEELQNFQDVTDVIQQLKKEIAELKKPKSNQLTEEELYALEEECGGDYGLNSNIGGYAQNLYPNLPGRLPSANPLQFHPALYPNLYPMYYPNLGLPQLPQAGSLPFAQDPQIPDFRALNALSQGLAQTSYGQTNLGQQGAPLSSWDTGAGLQLGLGQTGRQASLVVPQVSQPQTSVVPQETPNMFALAATSSYLPASVASTKPAPVNVVITSSDPLPKTSLVQTTQVLSVTIPPEHLKGSLPKLQPHNYQIPLPTTSVLTFTALPSIMNQPPLVVSTQELLSNISPPIYSAIDKNSTKSIGLGLKIEKSLSHSFNTSGVSDVSSIDEHDPCPDFKPIVPLPDEVLLSTGEENETVLFQERAKLYRFVNKEWKERGVGALKILQDQASKKVRILMRRDQVHKICANHFLTPDMVLTPKPNNPKAYCWPAHDFADEEMVVEKLCARFKSEVEAEAFFVAFNKARDGLTQAAKPSANAVEVAKSLETSASLGGFKFTSTPTFKPKGEEKTPQVAPQTKPQSNSPFAAFTFDAKTNTTTVFSSPIVSTVSLTVSTPKVLSSNFAATSPLTPSDDYEPNVDFKPVVPLPELVEVKTGEEDSEVLFESRSKLLRFDSSTKEWKERGLGNIKILKDKIIRLVMRREQIHKICCNHQLLRSMVFNKVPSNPKVLNWYAKDFSEGVLVTELFTIRFKTEELAEGFYNAIISAQDLLDENNFVKTATAESGNTQQSGGNKDQKKIKSETVVAKVVSPPKTTGWGDKFKPKLGSWECKNCFIVNDGKSHLCVACETPHKQTTPKSTPTTQQPASIFSFSTSSNVNQTQSEPLNLQSTAKPGDWGDMFKPKEGSWECKQCFIRNDGDKLHCVACDNPKNEHVGKKVPVTEEASEFKFNFGVVPTAKSAGDSSASSWGDAFKPQAGSWECSQCLVRNNADKLLCVACNSAKDGTKAKSDNSSNKSAGDSNVTSSWGDAFKLKAGTWECSACLVRNSPDTLHCISCSTSKDGDVPKKEPSKGINLDTPGQTFSFGIPVGKPTPDSKPLWGNLFNSKTDWDCGQCNVKNNANQLVCTNCKEVKDNYTPKKDGMPSSSTIKSLTNTSPFTFASQTTNAFNFGTCQMSSADSTAEVAKPFVFELPKTAEKTNSQEQFVFGSPQKHAFEFTPRSPRRISGGAKDGDESDSYVEDEGDHIYFKPIIPLPDKVEVKTGEENEKIVYCHRTKLFRFVDGEWKERGIGDIKILRTDDGKLRVVMRRDQILKICLNHKLTSEIEYLPKDEKTWLFSALDYSEGEYNRWQFCLRFKNAEIAQEFKKAVDEALKQTPAALNDTPTAETLQDFDSDVEFISETQVSPEEIQEALSLKLPPKFMAYRQLPDCTCETCKKEDLLLSDLYKSSPKLNTSSSTSFFDTSSCLFGTPCKPTSLDANATKSKFSFGNLLSKTTESTPPPKSDNKTLVTSPKNESLKEILMKPSMLANISNKNETTPVSTKSDAFSTFSFKPSTPVSTNLFAQSAFTFSTTTASTTPLFGNSSFTGFGTPTAQPPGNLFANSNMSSTQSIFGGNIFGTTTQVPATENKAEEKPLFGSATPMFGASASLTSLAAKYKGDQSDQKEILKVPDEIVLKCDTNLSFASLAAGTPNEPTFGKTASNDDKNAFSFLGAGAPVFGGQSKPVKTKNDSTTQEETAEGQEGEYDPHFEPIVPLPEAIVVCTGEEDEQVLFNERAKLFRFDNDKKEWKERGVGSLKILHHPVNGTYRIILRREQVHKVVLNMLITTTIDLQPMSTSDKAWLWCGFNYTEEEPAVEKLAARFKNCDIAKQFQLELQKCVTVLTQQQENKSLPSTVQNYVSEGDGDDEQEDDDEDDDRSVMFMKPCTLSEQSDTEGWVEVGYGDIQIYYDPEIYAAKISVIDETGLILSNTLIAMNTEMTIQECDCVWKAVEWAQNVPNWRVLKATFYDLESAQEFHQNYVESLQYARESEIVDGLFEEQESD